MRPPCASSISASSASTAAGAYGGPATARNHGGRPSSTSRIDDRRHKRQSGDADRVPTATAPTTMRTWTRSRRRNFIRILSAARVGPARPKRWVIDLMQQHGTPYRAIDLHDENSWLVCRRERRNDSRRASRSRRNLVPGEPNSDLNAKRRCWSLVRHANLDQAAIKLPPSPDAPACSTTMTGRAACASRRLHGVPPRAAPVPAVTQLRRRAAHPRLPRALGAHPRCVRSGDMPR